MSIINKLIPRLLWNSRNNYKTSKSIDAKNISICCQLRNVAVSSETAVENETKNTDTNQNEVISFSNFDEELRKTFKDRWNETYLPPKSDSLVHYVSNSKVLQFLANMNMKLYKVEKNHKETLNFLLSLDLKHDVGNKLLFLKNIGVNANEMGPMLTKNPHILNPEITIQMLHECLDYLKSKKFENDAILTILNRYPQILSTPVVKLDAVLGYFQNLPTKDGFKKIHFTGDELRDIITRCPRLLASDLANVFETVRTLEMSCGYKLSQIKRMIISYPRILAIGLEQIEVLFKFFTREMEYTNFHIIQFPEALGIPLHIIQPRHMYLCHLKRNIYYNKDPGYLPLTSLFGTNEEFCVNCKLGPVQNYYKFLKTL